MDCDATQAIDFAEYDDETDDEIPAGEKKTVSLIIIWVIRYIFDIHVVVSVRTQYYVTVRYGYHTRILRTLNIQFYVLNFTPPILRPPEI